MKYSSTTHRTSLLLGLALCGLLGCASSQKFDALLAKGEYEKAAKEAALAPRDIPILATSLIVQAIRSGRDISAKIDLLKTSAGTRGKCALKRLCRSAKKPASTHACIARAGSRLPRRSVLNRYLESEYGDVRVRAARKWASKMSDKKLLQLLADLDPGVRTAAVQALGERNPGDAVSAALKNTLLRDPVAIVRSAAARIPAALGEGAILDLKIALDDESLGVRLAALQGLAMLRQPAATDILRERANGRIDEMAVGAIVELHRQKEEGMESRLEEALESRRPIIRRAVLLRLERANTPRRLEFLEQALEDPDHEVVLLAARLISATEKGAAPARAALKKLVAEETPVAASARHLLATLGDKDAMEATRIRLSEGEEEEILTILKESYRCRELADAFAVLMGHPSEAIRLQAARASLLSTQ